MQKPIMVFVNEIKNQIICTDLESCKVGTSTIRKILVPYDDSKYSEHAFALSLDLAQHYGASITTLTIVYENPTTDLDISHQTSFDKDKIKKINEKFKLLKQNAKQFGITINNDIAQSREILDTILTYITTNKMDLVVMGSRSRPGPHRYAIGSIALGVCKSAMCPVMLVK
jgi:nucleotide-binding universal stress UspA family protein